MKFKEATKDQIEQMFKKFFPNRVNFYSLKKLTKNPKSIQLIDMLNINIKAKIISKKI